MGWVIFRGNTFTATAEYFRALFGLHSAPLAPPLPLFVSGQVICAIVLGIAFSAPLWSTLRTAAAKAHQAAPRPLAPAVHAAALATDICLPLALLVLCSAWLAGGTYNPFIYFRF